MFVRCPIGLYVLLNFLVQCQGERLSEKFGYPEDEEEANCQRQLPVFVQGLCKSGEIFYPGDQLDDWICDCKPAYLYHPATDQCYPAYKRGPCGTGEYLILPLNSGVPKCRPNRCRIDNFVLFQGSCHELDTAGPCTWGEQLLNLVGVNETTLEIICTKDYKIDVFLSRWSEDEGNRAKDTPPPRPIIPEEPSLIINGTNYAEKKCFVGGRRWFRAKQNVLQNGGHYFDCNY